MEPLERLKKQIFSREDKGGALTPFLALAQDFNCLENIVGSDYEIRDPKGNLVYTIRKKPWNFRQINQLLAERDKFIEAQKAEGKKGSRVSKGRGKR